MMSFRLSFEKVTTSNKTFISCTYGQRSDLNSNAGNETTIVEGIIERCGFVPSLDLDLMSMRNAADGVGRDRTGEW